MKRLALFAFIFFTIPAMATTWYVRPDGGTRYSVNQPSGQCNGQANAPYLGKGVNQPCAFDDIRYLWADGSYATGKSFPAWGWVGSGGDTYIVDCPADCRVGYSGPNNTASDYFLGIAGNPYGAGAPPPLNGTAAVHTRILGKNYANCTADTLKAHINGGYGVNPVINLMGASYVDLACFDITDHSDCVRSGGMPNQCQTSSPKSDYATNGIETSNSTTNVTITDVRVHGMVGAGIVGPTGDGVVVERVALVGNHSSGWNMDAGGGTTGTGNVTLDHVSILWNGCSEEYPIVDALPYEACNDQNSGGYGDGLGTATATSDPAWHMTISNSVAAYNTQDGFDLLHLQGNGSALTVTNSLMYGNMGQQLKVGAASTSRNNLIVGNCYALGQPIPGTPSGYNSKLTDFCRAADTAVVISVQDSTPTYYQFNTLYSAGDTGININCTGTCTSLSTLVYQDNIFVGFLNNAADGNPSGGNGEYPGYLYFSGTTGVFSNPGSVNSYNATYHQRSDQPCPNASLDEVDAICLDPLLTDETWHLYGYGDMAPSLDSPAVGMGIAIPGVTVDNSGNTRPSPPSIGALEYGSNLPVAHITIAAAPSPAALNQPITLTAKVAEIGEEVPTGTMSFLNGTSILGKASLDSSGTATLLLSGPPVGSYGIVGAYSGDTNYQPYESGVFLLQVDFTTTTILAASPNPATVGHALTLTATVKGSGTSVPAGTVTFMNGSTVLGTTTLNASGVATMSKSSLAVGTYSLTAKYSGGASFLTSTSAGASVTVNAQTSTTALTVSPNPATVGQAQTLTATVRGNGTSVPAGTVSFMSGSKVLGTAALNASGVATMSTSSLAVGTYSLTAKYSGGASLLTSTSAGVSVTVKAQTTATTLAVSPNPATAGQVQILTATVKGSGTSVPAGTISFMSGSTVLGTAALNASGVAKMSTSSLAVGTYSLTAKYSGGASFLTSTSVGISVTVKAQSTATTLTVSPNPATVGQAQTLTATVKGSGTSVPAGTVTGTSTPTGTVSFMSGSTMLGTAALNASGVATMSTSSLAVGTYSLTAKFSGKASFLTSTSAGVSVTVKVK